MTTPWPLGCNEFGECKHYLREQVIGPEDDPTEIRHFCRAYPDGQGIPDRYFFNTEKHTTVQSDQKGKFVYETNPER